MVPSAVLILLDFIISDLFLLFLEDGFKKDFFVLVLVTLGQEIELVVNLSVDLAVLSETSEETTEDSLSTNPEDLRWHAGVFATSSLSDAGVTSFALLLEAGASAEPGVDSVGPSENDSVLNQLLDVTTGCRQSNLACFLVVHPDAVAAALQHAGCESSL